MSTASAAPRAPAAEGIAISFCDPSERGYLRDIERLIRSKIDAVAHELPELTEAQKAQAEEPRRPHGHRHGKPGHKPGGHKPGGHKTMAATIWPNIASHGARRRRAGQEAQWFARPIGTASGTPPDRSMTAIFVDGDACPVKAEVEKVATRHGLAVTIVCNGGLRPSANPLVCHVMVPEGADAADDWIVEHIGAGRHRHHRRYSAGVALP